MRRILRVNAHTDARRRARKFNVESVFSMNPLEGHGDTWRVMETKHFKRDLVKTYHTSQ
jgi:hypothetical protein